MANSPVALITGASSGIGRACARALTDLGWNVVLAARSEDSLAETAAELPADRTLITPLDVVDAAAVEAAFTGATERFGRVDAVVHSAAVVGYGSLEDVPADVFERVVSVNLFGTHTVARAAVQHFRSQGRGRLVLIGSLLGRVTVPGMGPYTISKWGVHALARTLQQELRDSPQIQVSLVSPGSINTPIYLQAANITGWEGRPPPPVLQPEEVAKAVLRCLHRPRRDQDVGVANALLTAGFRFLPRLYDALVGPLAKVGTLSRRPLTPWTGTAFDPRPAFDRLHGVWNRFGVRTDDPGAREPDSTEQRR